MSKTVVLSALQTDGTDPGFDLFAAQIGAPAKIESRTRHAFGTVSRAGSHVLYMHADPVPEYDNAGIAAVTLQFTMPAAGYATFWAAVAMTPQHGTWQAVGGKSGQFGAYQQDSQPGDWRQFYLPLPAGNVSLAWQLYVDPEDASARTMWVSRIEAYAGDEKPTGIGPYYQGGLEDPNTVVIELLGFDDDSTAPGVTLNNGVTIEPKGAHPPPGDAAGRAGDYVAHFARSPLAQIDYSLTVTAEPRSYLSYTAAVRPGDGDFIEYRDGDDWNYPNADGTWQDIEESFDPGTYQLSWIAPAGTEAWLTKVRVFYPGPDSTMDVSPSAVTEGPDDGSGGGGGGGGGTPTPAGGYKRSEFVRHKGGLYIARVDGPTTEPGPGDSTDWFEMVAQPSAAAGGDPSPFACLVRATVGADSSPFAAGEEGLWIVLNDDRTAATDLRWQSST